MRVVDGEEVHVVSKGLKQDRDTSHQLGKGGSKVGLAFPAVSYEKIPVSTSEGGVRIVIRPQDHTL